MPAPSAGALALRQNHDQEARVLLEEALAIQREQQDRANIAVTLSLMGTVMEKAGNYALARSFYEESLAVSREVGDRWGIMNGLLKLAGIALDSALKEGDYASARHLLEETLARAREVEDKGTIALAIKLLGHIACLEGNYTLARSHFEDTLTVNGELGDKVGIAIGLNNLGVVAYQEGDYPGAGVLYEEGLQIVRETRLAARTADLLANLGLLACAEGNCQVAHSLFEESRAVGYKFTIPNVLVCLGWLACLQGNYVSARALLVESLTIRKEWGWKWYILESIEKLAYLAVAIGELAYAARLWGALQSIHYKHPLLPPPACRRDYERDLAAAQIWFSATGWGEAWREGQSMTLEEAVAYALAVEQESA